MLLNLLTLYALSPAAHSAADSFSGFDFPKTLLRRESFSQLKSADAIIYGNSTYGFFKAPTQNKNGRVEVEFFPPGYNLPIEFYAAEDNTRGKLLGKKMYSSPLKKAGVNPAVQRQGSFSTPFFMLSFEIKGVRRPLLINRQGEPVWTMDAGVLDATPMRAYVPVKISDDKIFYLGGLGTSTYWLADMKSGVGEKYSVADHGIIHHVADFDKTTRELVGLRYECKELPWWRENSPVFSGITNWINFFKLPRRTYAESKIVRLNLSTGEQRKIWSTSDSFVYPDDANLTLLSEMDRYVDIRTQNEYMALQANPRMTLRETGFDCDVDWSHENSVRFYPGQGYLVSIRNFNKVVMIGEDGKLKWSIGGSPRDTYQITRFEDQFSMQHDAWLVGADQVLLFDNHVPFRGWLDERHEKGSRVSQYRFANGRAIRVWSQKLPGPRADLRGTVHPLENGNVFVFDGFAHKALRFYELNRDSSGTAVAQMTLISDVSIPPFEARPVESIAGEKFLPKLQRAKTRLNIEAIANEVRSGY